MYGEITVPYEPIGGVNLMSDGDAGMEGSIQNGQDVGSIMLKWTEQGIINSGTFGYALGGYQDDLQNQATYEDIKNQGYETEEEINVLMRQYLARVLALQDDYTKGWPAFYNYFGPNGFGCVSIIGVSG